MEQTIKSPLPGIFYRRPSPHDDPYVDEGNRVQPGDVVGVIEIMKNFYEVKTTARAFARARRRRSARAGRSSNTGPVRGATNGARTGIAVTSSRARSNTSSTTGRPRSPFGRGRASCSRQGSGTAGATRAARSRGSS